MEARVSRMDAEVTADKANFSDLIEQLATIPGVSRLSAVTILSEIGTDMSRFETAVAGHDRESDDCRLAVARNDRTFVES